MITRIDIFIAIVLYTQLSLLSACIYKIYIYIYNLDDILLPFAAVTLHRHRSTGSEQERERKKDFYSDLLLITVIEMNTQKVTLIFLPPAVLSLFFSANGRVRIHTYII